MPIRPTNRPQTDGVVNPPVRRPAMLTTPVLGADGADESKAATKSWNPSHSTRFGGPRENRRGRKPVGTKNLSTIIMAIGNEEVEGVQNGKKIRMPRKAASFRSLSDQGLKGSVSANVRVVQIYLDVEQRVSASMTHADGNETAVQLTPQDQKVLDTLFAHLGITGLSADPQDTGASR